MFACDRCGHRYPCVSWKGWLLDTPFYMCDECWQEFFKIIPRHPMLSWIFGKKKMEKLKRRIIK